MTKTAHINGIDVVYATAGNAGAPAVLLHHPLATSLAYWDPIVPKLASDYHVIRFDARGHGRSTATAAPYDFATLARDTVALLDHLAVERAHVVGLSMGGMVGQELGIRHAARVRSLCLVSTTSRIAPEMKHLWVDRVAVARANGMGSQVEPCLARWVATTTRQERPDLVAAFSAMIMSTPIEGYAGWCAAISGLDMTLGLPSIRVPTRVIVGALDPATPVAASETIHRAIAGSDLVVMPGVSHMLSSEAPDAFANHVREFLARHP